MTDLRNRGREPWWAYALVWFLTGLWSLSVALLATFVVAWNPYIVWAAAWCLAINAIVYKVARRG